MQLNQEQKQDLIQILKIRIILGCTLVVFIITSVCIINGPIKNFIRSYKPLPTAELHHQ